MKQVLQYRRSGATRVVDVPAPLVPDGGVLVHNRWSLISPGTERMLVEAGGANLVGTAMQRPDLVKAVLDKARREGVGPTIQAVMNRIDTAIPLGYSSAGVVLEAAPDTGYQVGDRVACAGAGKANHAEFVGVTKHLTARIPDNVSFEDASFVTIGAIAMQGVRIADVRVGESCLVIGLGLVGQLTVQILKAAGCRVFGVDMAQDKVAQAKTSGADEAMLRSDPRLIEAVMAFSGGRGVDAVVITAATTSSDPVELAAKVARDRGVVASVGLTGLDVPRNAYYDKELQLRLSRSYGPGRYDKNYEELGVDYPVGQVRWTEQRNMESFLQLVSEGKIQPSKLVTHRFGIDQAVQAYAIVTGDVKEPYLGILLQYSEEALPSSRVQVAGTVMAEPKPVRLGVVGAGNFAKGVLLPKLKGLPVSFVAVATAQGQNAQDTAARFGFQHAASDWRQIIDDADINAVLVATRHDLHPVVAAAALRAGKAVFLEKPVALTQAGLDDVIRAQAQTRALLQVGFNRRFAPAMVQAKEHFVGRTYALTMNYRVNAGAVASNSWVVDPIQGGGRLIGEVCHMVDTLSYLTNARVMRVFAQPLPGATTSTDDILVTMTFQDGSIGTITYVAGGDRSVAKERLEIHGGGKSAVVDDFTSLTLHAAGASKTHRLGAQDKGHAAELQAFVWAVKNGGNSSLGIAQAAHVTEVTFAALESARTGAAMDLPD
jgi:polar amino acid transport system substrate-binding protein